MKKSASLLKIIRLLIGLGLLAIVIKQLDFAKIKNLSSLALQHPQYLIIATLMTFLGLFSGVIRWWRILKGMGFDFSFTYVFVPVSPQAFPIAAYTVIGALSISGFMSDNPRLHAVIAITVAVFSFFYWWIMSFQPTVIA